MITQGHVSSNLVSIQATVDEVRAFREDVAFYLQTVRQSANRFEFHIGRIAKNADAEVIDTVLGGNDVIANMRTDMSKFEDKWAPVQ